MVNKKIYICQPGNGSSCAFCCGSHNYRAQPEEISVLFSQRYNVFSGMCKSREKASSKKKQIHFEDKIMIITKLDSISMPPILEDAIQCPYVGFIDDNNTVGCLLYSMRDLPILKKYNTNNNTCQNFTCLAMNTLSNDEIIFATLLMRDWYFYSLLINEINVLRQIKKDYKSPENVPGDVLAALKDKLVEEIKAKNSR